MIFHHRDAVAEDIVRVVRHRSGQWAGSFRGLYRASKRGVDNTTSQAGDLGVGRANKTNTVPLHDNDGKFAVAFDAVFASERIKVIRTTYRAPNANAHAERWVGTVREECLDKVIILASPDDARIHYVLQ